MKRAGHRAQLASANTNPMSSASVRVQLARSVGGWDGARERAADWDLWQRMLEDGARSACSPEPTVLHLRASGREQPWSERVRQATAWLDRLQDPRQTVDIRILARRARAEHDASVEQHACALDEHAAMLTQRVVALQERDAAREARAATREAQVRALGRELDADGREPIMPWGQAARAEETLGRIDDGGWWRLRNRLRSIVRIAGHSR